MKSTRKTQSLLLGPTDTSAVNISGTIHSTLGIKPRAKLNGLMEKAKASLRNKSSNVKLLMINDISMVSSDFWTEIDVRLSEIFRTSIELQFLAFQWR